MENEDWSPVVAEQQRAKDKHTIDALVAALEEVSKLRRVLRDEGLLEQVEDALALARKGATP